jgi:hypothetical protein
MTGDSSLSGWIEELPFPLSSIAWRYYAIVDEGRKVRALAQFFEATALFLSSVFLGAFLRDPALTEVVRRLGYRPEGGRERFDFGSFGKWVKVSRDLAKATRELLSNPSGSTQCTRAFCVEAPDRLRGVTDKALFSALAAVGTQRNEELAHGGVESPLTAKRILTDLEPELLKIRTALGGAFREWPLIRPGHGVTEQSGRSTYVAAELLSGRDPSLFVQRKLVSNEPLLGNDLYLFDDATRLGLRLAPLVRIRTDENQLENTCYFFSRLRKDDVHWVSYHDARSPSADSRDPEVASLIGLLNGEHASSRAPEPPVPERAVPEWATPPSGDERLQDHERGTDVPPLALRPPAERGGDDGGPQPIAEVSAMLPGGRWTRGKPGPFYVPTLLDKRLLPRLIQGPPTLVVLSGNAGDGKTAFLTELITKAGHSYDPGTQNEYDLLLGGTTAYRVVLDGSEDADDRTNDDLLNDALTPFAGSNPIDEPPRGTIIAINKGRLLNYLERNVGRYGFLWRLISSAFLGESLTDAESRYILIDLNERSFIGPNVEGSLFGDFVSRLVDWNGWGQCNSCHAQAVCPVYFNIMFLRTASKAEGSNGDPVPLAQLWRLFAASDLDDRIHITARHVVTALTGFVVGENQCSEIRARAGRGEIFAGSEYVYNRPFLSAETHDVDAPLIDKVIATYDPTEQDTPIQGRLLHSFVAREEIGKITAPVESYREAYLDADVASIGEERIENAPKRGDLDYRQRVRRLTRAVSRRLYFQGASELAPRFPLDTVDEFLQILAQGAVVIPGLIPRLIQNLNGALGIESGRLQELLVPRDYSNGLRGRGFAMLIKPSRFHVVVGSAVGLPYRAREFIESWPRSLLMSATDANGTVVAVLVIPLLLFELLDRAGHGRRPASQTERAYMVRLRGFYRALAEHSWEERPSYVLYDNGDVLARANVDGDKFWLATE